MWAFPVLYGFSFRYVLTSSIYCLALLTPIYLKRSCTFLIFDVIAMEQILLPNWLALLSKHCEIWIVVYTRLRGTCGLFWISSVGRPSRCSLIIESRWGDVVMYLLKKLLFQFIKAKKTVLVYLLWRSLVMSTFVLRLNMLHILYVYAY